MGDNTKTPDATPRRAKDWSAQFAGRVIWWVIPALIGVAASSFTRSPEQTGFVFAGVFAWAGTGCVLNAWRCGRLHCFFSGPALWVGAIGAALVGFNVLPAAHDLNYVVLGTVALVVASRLPEAIWGKYTRSDHRGSFAAR